jgi:hypothetical protein
MLLTIVSTSVKAVNGVDSPRLTKGHYNDHRSQGALSLCITPSQHPPGYQMDLGWIPYLHGQGTPTGYNLTRSNLY